MMLNAMILAAAVVNKTAERLMDRCIGLGLLIAIAWIFIRCLDLVCRFLSARTGTVIEAIVCVFLAILSFFYAFLGFFAHKSIDFIALPFASMAVFGFSFRRVAAAFDERGDVYHAEKWRALGNKLLKVGLLVVAAFVIHILEKSFE